MPKTPDRFPGEADEEGLLLEEAGSDPTTVGGMRLVGGDFRLRDSAGVFNPRTGGSGITAEEHRNLDQLVHGLAENFFEEYTYTGGKVTNVTTWETSGKLKKVREEQYAYSSGKVSQVVTIQYDGSGNEVERVTESYAYLGSKVTSVTAVRATP